jgi:YD repeat-containing protein
MVRLKSALCRAVRAHWFVWLLLNAVFFSIAHAETQCLYDDLGRLVVVAHPDGSALAYEHDTNGNIVGIHQRATKELVISTFDPSYGPAGTQVTISGSGLYPALSQNIVRIGGTPATVNSASGSTFIVTVPLGAQTAPICIETGGDAATSSQDFDVRRAATSSRDVTADQLDHSTRRASANRIAVHSWRSASELLTSLRIRR